MPWGFGKWDYSFIKLFNSYDKRKLQESRDGAEFDSPQTSVFQLLHVQIYRFVLLLANRRRWPPVAGLDHKE